MVVVAALLFVLVVGLTGALAGAGVYYVRVLRPRLAASTAPTPEAERRVEHDPVAAVVDELNALARLRDQGVLTAREFTSKKGELLQRI
jgi:hypothetical protein